MRSHINTFLATAVGVLAFSAVGTPVAGAGEPLTAAERSFTERIAEGAAVASSEENGTATISRRRLPRKMTNFVAKSKALEIAEYVYNDPEINWTGYGARSCKRQSRSRVDCYSYVYEEVYDDYGYYLDTILCDWYTASAYLRSGRLKVWTYARDCVLLSEI